MLGSWYTGPRYPSFLNPFEALFSAPGAWGSSPVEANYIPHIAIRAEQVCKNWRPDRVLQDNQNPVSTESGPTEDLARLTRRPLSISSAEL
jgi:hypothetical protein